MKKEYLYKVSEHGIGLFILIDMEWYLMKCGYDSLCDAVKEMFSSEIKKIKPDFDISEYTSRELK
jgi:hypothetical protein